MSELRTNRIVPRDGLPSGSSGGVIQVKSTTKTDTDSFTSTSFTDVTGLSVSITPTRSDSKILIFVSIHGVGNSSTQAYFRFMRDSTAICVGDAAGSRVQATLGSLYHDQSNDINCASQTFLDSPSTTSAVTYKVQCRTQGSGTIHVNRSDTDANDTTSGRFTSSITVMEVSG
tara:strand:- start:20 stop:538 length:519 start_codon:yes stop_codon:yes gene_type:complete